MTPEAMALRLQKLRIPKTVFGADDTLVWYDRERIRFAFRGDAESIESVTNRENRDGEIGMLRNVNHELDAHLQYAVGYKDVEIQKRGYGYEVVNGVGQTLDAPSASFADVLDSMAEMASSMLDGEPEVRFTLMPNEGEPWVPETHVTGYFEAARKKNSVTDKPDWLTKVMVRASELDPRRQGDIEVYGADVCHMAQSLPSSAGPLLGDAHKGTEFMVTHSFEPAPPYARHTGSRLNVRDSAELVRRCGGWIYPSCAVGKFAATTFGPVTLVAGSNLVLQPLRARMQRARASLSLYETDTWTPNTRDVLGIGAHVLYEQLCGVAEYSIYSQAMVNHQWVLGPPVRLAGPSGPNAKMVTSAAELRKALRARYRRWREDLSPEEVNELIEEASMEEGGWSVHRYPYLEAKMNALVEPTAWRVAVVANSWARDAEEFLAHVGFEGEMLRVEDPEGTDYEIGWHLAGQPALAYEQSLRVLEAVRENT